jgi:hypothetical protein
VKAAVPAERFATGLGPIRALHALLSLPELPAADWKTQRIFRCPTCQVAVFSRTDVPIELRRLTELEDMASGLGGAVEPA